MADVENVSPVVADAATEPEAKRQKTENVESLISTRIPFVKLSEAAKAPFRGSEFAAGADLHASESCTIPPKGKALISTGLKLALPVGTYGRVAPRSGLALKQQIDVGAGVVDEDYRGEVKVLLFNFGAGDFAVKEGDRIAQFVCQEISSSSTAVLPEVVNAKVECYLASEKAKFPLQSDAGFYMSSSEDGVIEPGKMLTVATGIHLAIPSGYYGHAVIDNALAVEHGLKCFAGVVDEDYRGEFKILLFNHGKEAFNVKSGEPLVEIICEKVVAATYEAVEELTATDRGEGGFGSTGTAKLEKNQEADSVRAITWTKMNDDATDPAYGSALAAGADVFAAEDTVVAPSSYTLVSTGIKLSVKPGHYARIAPRSGLAVKHFIDVGAGIYKDDEELKVLLFNHGEQEFAVKKGDRIAQIVAERIAKIELAQVEKLSDTKRGTDGFGSTGVSA